MRRHPPPPEGYEDALKRLLLRCKEISTAQEQERISNEFGTSEDVNLILNHMKFIQSHSISLLSNLSRIPNYYAAFQDLDDPVETYEAFINQQQPVYLDDWVRKSSSIAAALNLILYSIQFRKELMFQGAFFFILFYCRLQNRFRKRP